MKYIHLIIQRKAVPDSNTIVRTDDLKVIIFFNLKYT